MARDDVIDALCVAVWKVQSHAAQQLFDLLSQQRFPSMKEPGMWREFIVRGRGTMVGDAIRECVEEGDPGTAVQIAVWQAVEDLCMKSGMAINDLSAPAMETIHDFCASPEDDPEALSDYVPGNLVAAVRRILVKALNHEKL